MFLYKKSKFNVFKSLDCKNVRNGKFEFVGKKSVPLKTAGPRLRRKIKFPGKRNAWNDYVFQYIM